jgi:hypothetical protein
VTLVLLIILLLRVIGEKYTSFMLFFSIFLFSIPYDWENTLAGFQAQFYFLILFSIISLWYTSTEKLFSARWWLGIGGAVIASLSFASGIFVFASQAFIRGMFYLLGLRKTKKQIIAIVIPIMFFLLGIAAIPFSDGDTKTILFFVRGLAKVFSWPLGTTLVTVFDWPLATYFFAVFLCNFPSILFTALMLWKRPDMNDRRWFLVSLVIWALGQNLSIAFGRGAIAPRYLTLFVLFLLINFVCFITISQFFTDKPKRWISKSAGVWFLIMVLSLVYYSGKYVPQQLIEKKETGILQENNIRNYLLTNDLNHLENKPFLHIPYPSAKRLALILESDDIRNILPSNIREPVSYVSVRNVPDNQFSFSDCCDQTTPKLDYETFGSYGEEGDISTGIIIIEFDFNHSRSPWVKVPVAGYPLSIDMKLEIEQNGERTLIPIASNSRDTWREINIKVRKGVFFIRLTDLSSKIWAAFGMPVEVGRLDMFVDILLINYDKFLILGFILCAVSIISDKVMPSP